MRVWWSSLHVRSARSHGVEADRKGRGCRSSGTSKCRAALNVSHGGPVKELAKNRLRTMRRSRENTGPRSKFPMVLCTAVSTERILTVYPGMKLWRHSTQKWQSPRLLRPLNRCRIQITAWPFSKLTGTLVQSGTKAKGMWNCSKPVIWKWTGSTHISKVCLVTWCAWLASPSWERVAMFMRSRQAWSRPKGVCSRSSCIANLSCWKVPVAKWEKRVKTNASLHQ